VQSQAEVLTEFLTAGHPRAGSLLERLRAMSVPVDGWHTVVRLEVDNLLETVADDEVAAHELTRLLERQAHATARAEGGVWHRARADQALLLVSMQREDPGSRGSTTVAHTAERVIERVRASEPRLTMACGVGTAHNGPAGLRASAAEARSALGAARLARRANVPVCFDVIGLRRTVIEWYASDSAREAVDSVLAPLDALGDRRSTEAIHTLQVYLDQQGSLARAAEVLHLHRNAVRYRIRRIFELLDVDADEPDQRLILQLACRARSLRP
jgi:sugar diacid utilization regulator